jgi:hypothetical protein
MDFGAGLSRENEKKCIGTTEENELMILIMTIFYVLAALATATVLLRTTLSRPLAVAFALLWPIAIFFVLQGAKAQLQYVILTSSKKPK